MDFNKFSLEIAKIKNLPLPGTASHYKMAPEIRIKELNDQTANNRKPKKAGVMALFYPGASFKTNLLFIQRNTYPGVHSGQIGFPGGQREAGDTDMKDTALRESSEEVGVVRKNVDIIKSITELYIPPSNFEVSPYIGLYHKEQAFERQVTEVEALIEIPLTEIMDDTNMTTQMLSTSYADQIEVPVFVFQGHTVWGATAMMLNEIRELLKKVL